MRPKNIVSLDATIYEFRGQFFVIEESQQGKDLLPTTAHQRPGELRSLAGVLPVDGPPDLLGRVAKRALQNFDIEPPKHDPWELAAMRKQLVGWLGARGFATIVKNSRFVKLSQNVETGEITLYPSDNHQSNPWYGVRLDKALTLNSECDEVALGEAILAAFNLSTYHPDRSDPPALQSQMGRSE